MFPDRNSKSGLGKVQQLRQSLNEMGSYRTQAGYAEAIKILILNTSSFWSAWTHVVHSCKYRFPLLTTVVTVSRLYNHRQTSNHMARFALLDAHCLPSLPDPSQLIPFGSASYFYLPSILPWQVNFFSTLACHDACSRLWMRRSSLAPPPITPDLTWKWKCS